MRLPALLALAVALCLLHGEARADPVHVMSFNLRYGTARDGADHWDRRKDLVLETIEAQAPDLLGTQECMAFQGGWLRERLPDHEFFGEGRDGGQSGEMCALFWRRDRFEPLDRGHLWLSETPETPGSRSWDSALPRMLTWVRLRDRSDGSTLLFANTHFDHRGRQARLESAKLLSERLPQLADGAPIVLTGDFNAPAAAGQDQPYGVLTGSLVDTLRVVTPEPTEDEGTFNGFRGRTGGARIDWILTSPGVEVSAAEIDRTHRGERWPSDHCPVVATLSLTRWF